MLERNNALGPDIKKKKKMLYSHYGKYHRRAEARKPSRLQL